MSRKESGALSIKDKKWISVSEGFTFVSSFNHASEYVSSHLEGTTSQIITWEMIHGHLPTSECCHYTLLKRHSKIALLLG